MFLGNDVWSVPSLEALGESRHEVALVVTRTPRPAPRGSDVAPTPVAEAAVRLDHPLAEVDTVRSGPGLEEIVEAHPDMLVVVAYGEILTEEVLDIAPAVNVHFSLLPALRGASPVQHALLAGLAQTGVTTMRMDRNLDTGPILLQAKLEVLPEDDAGSLGKRLALRGASLLVESLDRRGEIEPRAQDHSKATYAPKLGPEDRRLDWEEDAEAIVRRIRAFAPEPGTSASFRGDVLKILRARAEATGGQHGTILDVMTSPLVGCGRGSVLLLEVAPAGRKRMSGTDFVNGFRPEVGEPLE